MGTGKVAFIADDENDPTGEGIAVPPGALSGELFGWNRELLASHYGECYWKIVDKDLDAEIRDRYRSILINKFTAAGLDEELAADQADDMVAEAVKKQAMGAVGAVKVQVSRASVSSARDKANRPKRHHGGVDREELERLRRENEEFRARFSSVSEDAEVKKSENGKKNSTTEGNLGAD